MVGTMYCRVYHYQLPVFFYGHKNNYINYILFLSKYLGFYVASLAKVLISNGATTRSSSKFLAHLAYHLNFRYLYSKTLEAPIFIMGIPFKGNSALELNETNMTTWNHRIYSVRSLLNPRIYRYISK